MRSQELHRAAKLLLSVSALLGPAKSSWREESVNRLVVVETCVNKVTFPQTSSTKTKMTTATMVNTESVVASVAISSEKECPYHESWQAENLGVTFARLSSGVSRISSTLNILTYSSPCIGRKR